MFCCVCIIWAHYIYKCLYVCVCSHVHYTPVYQISPMQISPSAGPDPHPEQGGGGAQRHPAGGVQRGAAVPQPAHRVAAGPPAGPAACAALGRLPQPAARGRGAGAGPVPRRERTHLQQLQQGSHHHRAGRLRGWKLLPRHYKYGNEVFIDSFCHKAFTM